MFEHDSLVAQLGDPYTSEPPWYLVTAGSQISAPELPIPLCSQALCDRFCANCWTNS